MRTIRSGNWGRSWLAALLALGILACATYRDDLDRATLHYNANEYQKALTLLEVLELDIDSLSEAERAQYAYYRGMAHFRVKQRRDARHWLGRSAAREQANAGALSPEEKKRVSDTLEELNKDWHGGAEKTTEAPKRCSADTECVRGEFCDAGSCKPSPGGPAATATAAAPTTMPAMPTAPPPPPKPTAAPPPPAPKPPAPKPKGKSCERALDCPGAQICSAGVCVEPTP